MRKELQAHLATHQGLLSGYTDYLQVRLCVWCRWTCVVPGSTRIQLPRCRHQAVAVAAAPARSLPGAPASCTSRDWRRSEGWVRGAEADRRDAAAVLDAATGGGGGRRPRGRDQRRRAGPYNLTPVTPKLKAGCAAQRQTGAMLQLCLTRPPPAEAGGGHAGVISAGELDRLGLLLRGPAEAAAGASASELDGSPMDVSPTPFQGAPLG